jgi:short-subunit dehydrogenase
MRKLFIGIGAGPGLGASTAERFAQEGFDILLTARNRNRVLELADAIGNKTGVKATALELDASNPKAIAEFTEKHASSADVVHFNAAGMSSPVLQDTSVESLENDLRVNITSPLLLIKGFTSHLAKKKRKGNDSAHRRRFDVATKRLPIAAIDKCDCHAGNA